MLSFLIALLVGFAGAAIAYVNKLSLAWIIIIGLAAMLAAVIVLSLIIRRKVKKVNMHIQEVMTEIQRKLTLKQNQFMRKPLGSPKAMMQVLEKDQAAGLRQVIAICDEFKPYYWWSFMLDRQINTMKMAFYYQLKEFDKVDALMPKCLFIDPQAVCMKLARMYMKQEAGIDKLFRKKCRMLKEPACILPYSLYAWILVKQGKPEEALKVLVEAKKKTDNEVIVHNWELLANNKVKNFSNANLGEPWYALGLEAPKIQKVQQARYR